MRLVPGNNLIKLDVELNYQSRFLLTNPSLLLFVYNDAYIKLHAKQYHTIWRYFITSLSQERNGSIETGERQTREKIFPSGLSRLEIQSNQQNHLDKMKEKEKTTPLIQITKDYKNRSQSVVAIPECYFTYVPKCSYT